MVFGLWLNSAHDQCPKANDDRPSSMANHTTLAVVSRFRAMDCGLWSLAQFSQRPNSTVGRSIGPDRGVSVTVDDGFTDRLLPMGNHRDLQVWQRAYQFAGRIDRETR